MNAEQVREMRRAWYLKNSEKVKARVRRYQRENKEKIRLANRRRCLKNPGKIKARRHAYYLKHRERRLKWCRDYHLKNRAKLLERMRARYRDQAEHRKTKQRLYYKKNRDEVREYQKVYAAKNPEKVKARTKRYRDENIDYLRAYDRLRAKNLSPKRKAAMVLWRLNNRERIRAYAAARKLKAVKLLGGKCATCAWSEDLSFLEIDHIVSFLKRGVKRPRTSNLGHVFKNPSEHQALCPICHAIKTATEKRHPGPKLTYSQQETRRRRIQILEKYGNACGPCGYDKSVLALQFDHITPINGVGRSSAIHLVRKDPSKFQLLCALCHRKKTRKDNLKKWNSLMVAALKAVEVAGA